MSLSTERAGRACENGKGKGRRKAYLVGHPAEHGFYLLGGHRLPVDMNGIMCDLGCAEEGDWGAGSVEWWQLWFGRRLGCGISCVGRIKPGTYGPCTDVV